MVLKMPLILILLLAVSAIGQSTARADHDKDKSKIYDKFEIVSFGQTQSFIGTNLRILEGAEEWFGQNSDNKTVYEKRYETLKLHWDDFRKKCDEKHVNMKKEPIYFGYIQWTPKDPITGLPQDHKVQFYLAARKKPVDGSSGENRGNELPDSAKYSLHAPKSSFSGWFIDIDGKDSAKEGKGAFARNFVLAKEDGARWRATKGKHGTKLSIIAPRNQFDGWYLDIDGKSEAEGKGTFARNVILTKGDGAADWDATAGKNGVKLAVKAPNNKFNGWYLDIDGKAKESTLGRAAVARNFIISKDDGPEWQPITK